MKIDPLSSSGGGRKSRADKRYAEKTGSESPLKRRHSYVVPRYAANAENRRRAREISMQVRQAIRKTLGNHADRLGDFNRLHTALQMKRRKSTLSYTRVQDKALAPTDDTEDDSVPQTNELVVQGTALSLQKLK